MELQSRYGFIDHPYSWKLKFVYFGNYKEKKIIML